METYRVNSRVQDLDGFRGTVRYVGPVAAAKNQQELWLGKARRDDTNIVPEIVLTMMYDWIFRSGVGR